jgi:hypothetical protein
LSKLEHEAMSNGFTEIHIETHSRWQSAVNFYQRAGYQATSKK